MFIIVSTESSSEYHLIGITLMLSVIWYILCLRRCLDDYKLSWTKSLGQLTPSSSDTSEPPGCVLLPRSVNYCQIGIMTMCHVFQQVRVPCWEDRTLNLFPPTMPISACFTYIFIQAFSFFICPSLPQLKHFIGGFGWLHRKFLQ